MAANVEQYDTALLGILHNEGKVAPFMDTILGFLYRRTDFFRTMKSENEKLGFPPGVAYKLLVNIFKKYETLASKDAARTEEMKKAREENAKYHRKPIQQDQQSDMDKNKARENIKSSVQSAERGANEFQNIPETENGTEEVKMETDKSEDRLQSEKEAEMEAEKPTTQVESTQELKDAEKLEPLNKPTVYDSTQEDDGDDPEKKRERQKLQSNPLTYNGAEREAYFWSQNITEADVRVKVPDFIKKGKQVTVDIQKKHICVSYQASDGTWTQTVGNDLMWDINKEESMWTLSPGEFVHINLEKREERWWSCVFVNEPEINTRKIDCSRSMLDLDDEAQAKIEEMMYNQRQKQLGLPQSHEQKTHDMLRKAWDAEGSPFKGQPFDPSKFNIDQSGIANIKDQMDAV